MRSPPAGLRPESVAKTLADGWRLRPASMEYVPEGGGSHHWKLTSTDGQPTFITVDDLDDKAWLGDSRQQVLDGLRRALTTAAALRCQAGLDFVVAPVAASDGEVLRPVDDRYTVSVFPYLAGHAHPFGPYADSALRDRAIDLIAALHRATPVVRDRAPSHLPGFTGRADLKAFLLETDRRWDGGPFSEAAHHLLAARSADLARLADGFDHLVEVTAPTRANLVITHGEPHPANVMSANGRLHLIDWDTTALAPPERDVCLIAAASNEGIDRYQQATGRELDPAVITRYRLRWYLDDLGSAIRMFRNPHHDNADTQRWLRALEPQLGNLQTWLDHL